MDRAPIGHAVHVEGAWRGKVRSGGSVVWVSEGFADLEAAKSAVEVELAGRPEVVSAALREAA